METLVRFGFVIRGILYFLTGFYGLMVAIGLSGSTKDTVGIIKILGSIPFGNIILLTIFIGCVGYGVWGLVRARRQGKVISRIGYFSSGLWYLFLGILPIQLLLKITTSPMSFSFPKIGWFVAGLLIVVVGVSQIIYGFREKFKKTLKTIKSEKQEDLIMAIGKYGYIARGVTFVLLGTTFVLGRAPGDPILLGLVSVGLMALGIYSIIASRVSNLKPYANKSNL